ncbi:vesicular inhibitory amino acid transporter [Hydra vulgaris]|uniref:Vesicular inhibitory amino acid transporter n=1 Tax=Hydra vulgaris TaxID=6087 RepID=A0ABM4CZL2_HYDVU
MVSEERQALIHNDELLRVTDPEFNGVNASGSEQCESSPRNQNETSVKQEDLTTVCETFWNICNTIQGLPILAIPYTFKSGGWWSLLTLVIVAAASNYTSIILVRSLYEIRDGVKVRVRSSYMDIGEAFWEKGGRLMVMIIMVIELVFVATMYPILVGAMFNKSFPDISLPIWAWTMIGGIALLPNTLLKNLSQVAWTSILTVSSAIIIFVSIVAYSIARSSEWQVSNMNNFEPNEFPAALGILVACYLAQPFVPFIESTMKRPEKFESTLNYAFIAMSIMSVLVGIFADLTFYPDTDEVVTNNLPVGAVRQIVNAMAAILAFTSYTLPMFTSFDIIEKSNFPCFPADFGNNVYSLPVQMMRLLLVLATIFMAAFIPRFTYLLALIGSITGIALEFIFPALFHMKIYCMHLRWYEFGIDILIVFIGTLTMTISLIVSWISLYNCFAFQNC